MFVKSTEYARVRDDLVRLGRHVFVAEALTSRDLMAQYFSSQGSVS